METKLIQVIDFVVWWGAEASLGMSVVIFQKMFDGRKFIG